MRRSGSLHGQVVKQVFATSRPGGLWASLPSGVTVSRQETQDFFQTSIWDF